VGWKHLWQNKPTGLQLHKGSYFTRAITQAFPRWRKLLWSPCPADLTVNMYLQRDKRKDNVKIYNILFDFNMWLSQEQMLNCSKSCKKYFFGRGVSVKVQHTLTHLSILDLESGPLSIPGNISSRYKYNQSIHNNIQRVMRQRRQQCVKEHWWKGQTLQIFRCEWLNVSDYWPLKRNLGLSESKTDLVKTSVSRCSPVVGSSYK